MINIGIEGSFAFQILVETGTRPLVTSQPKSAVYMARGRSIFDNFWRAFVDISDIFTSCDQTVLFDQSHGRKVITWSATT